MKFLCFQPLTGYTASAAVADRIDKATGLIKGVKIISSGAAKGHGVLIDDTTLTSVLKCAQKYGTGLKVKFNPDTFNHGDGSIVGFVPKASYRIENGALLGDLQLNASYEKRGYILELAESQPDTFGLSIDFSGDPEEISGVKFARCTEIYAVTIVDEPAANDTGLFKATEDKPTKQPTRYLMTPEDKKEFAEMLKEGLSGIDTRLSAVETGMKKGMSSDEDEKEPAVSGMSADSIAAERLAAGVATGETGAPANRKIHAYRRTQARPATVADIETIVSRQVTGLMAGAANNGVTHNLRGAGGNDKEHAFTRRLAGRIAAGDKPAQAIWRAKADAPKEFEDWEKLGRPMPAKVAA